jgi:hypothetical protein
MIICFTCLPHTKQQLDELMSKGTYSDYSDLISAAVNNLAVMERTAANGGSVLVESHSQDPAEAPDVASSTRIPPPRRAIDLSFGAATDVAPVTDSVTKSRRAIELGLGGDAVPHIFSRSASRLEPPGDSPEGLNTDMDDAKHVPLERWVFGQFSKFLPVKAACRALANLSTEHPSGFEFDKVGTRVAADAAVLAEYLAAIDRRDQRLRDDALALGFPSNDENADRSRLRYATQYVGTLTNGRPSGMMFDFKLASVTNGMKLQLTEAGWRFALLENPALDHNRGDRFGRDEIAFLVDHIRSHVRVEDFAYHTILQGIRTGANTPQKIDRVCKRQISPEREGDISDAFVTTQRTGVVSRLNELGLMGRRREGVRVTYFVTDQGNEYLERAAA